MLGCCCACLLATGAFGILGATVVYNYYPEVLSDWNYPFSKIPVIELKDLCECTDNNSSQQIYLLDVM